MDGKTAFAIGCLCGVIEFASVLSHPMDNEAALLGLITAGIFGGLWFGAYFNEAQQEIWRY